MNPEQSQSVASDYAKLAGVDLKSANAILDDMLERLPAIVRKHKPSGHDTESIVHQIYLRLLEKGEHIGKIAGENSRSGKEGDTVGYMYRLAINKIRDIRRADLRRKEVVGEDMQDAEAREFYDGLEDRMNALLPRLQPIEQELVVRYFVDRIPYDDLLPEMQKKFDAGMTIEKLYQTVRRTKDRLRILLGEGG